MKKTLLFFFIYLLFVIPGVSAQRIRPNQDIGIFVNPDLFSTGLHKMIIDSDAYILQEDKESTYLGYLLSNDIDIFCSINQYGKIDSIIIGAPQDIDLKSYWNTICDVFLVTGLANSEDDFWNIINQLPNYEGEYFSLVGWFEDSNNTYITMITKPLNRDFSKQYGCDSNYVGACVPVTNKNLDCKDIGVKNFFVVGTDTHYFDGDKNGVCCEPYYPEWATWLYR